MSEAVEVIAEAALIETTKSDLGGVVTPHEIQNLPLLNRTFAGLSIVMPEARPVGNFDPTKTRIGNFAMSGGDGRQLDVNVDGGDNKDNVGGQPDPELRLRVHPGVPGAAAPLDGGERPLGGRRRERGLQVGDQRLRGHGLRQLPRRRDAHRGLLREAAAGGDPTSEGGVRARGVRRLAGRAHPEGQAVLLRRPGEVPRALHAEPGGGARSQLQAIPGAEALSEIPTPYDDTLGTSKLDWHPATNHTLFARFAYQDLSSPNDQIPVPATADLNNGNTNTTTNYDFVASHTWTLGGDRLNQFAFHFQDFKNEILPNVTGVPFLDFPSVDTGPNATRRSRPPCRSTSSATTSPGRRARTG